MTKRVTVLAALLLLCVTALPASGQPPSKTLSITGGPTVPLKWDATNSQWISDVFAFDGQSNARFILVDRGQPYKWCWRLGYEHQGQFYIYQGTLWNESPDLNLRAGFRNYYNMTVR